jgi:hypothetical protein
MRASVGSQETNKEDIKTPSINIQNNRDIFEEIF